MEYLKTLGITLSNIHYQHINSNKKFTLLIHNNKYYFSNRKLSHKCLQFKHLVKDKNNKHFILSFENHNFIQTLLNGYIYLKSVNCSTDCNCSSCNEVAESCYHNNWGGGLNCNNCCSDETNPIDCNSNQNGQWCPSINPTPEPEPTPSPAPIPNYDSSGEEYIDFLKYDVNLDYPCVGFDDCCNGGWWCGPNYPCAKGNNNNRVPDQSPEKCADSGKNLPDNITNATAYWDCGFGDTEVIDGTSINGQSFGTNFAPVWVGKNALKSNMSEYGEDIWMIAAASHPDTWKASLEMIPWELGKNCARLKNGNQQHYTSGKCILINNPIADNDYNAIVMLADSGMDLPDGKHAQIDMAIPGMDSPESIWQRCSKPGCINDANECNELKYTSITGDEASMQGNTALEYINCENIRSGEQFDAKRLQDGCKIFKKWFGYNKNWEGKSKIKFVGIPCPEAFVKYIEESRKSNDHNHQKTVRKTGVFKMEDDSDVYGNIPYDF